MAAPHESRQLSWNVAILTWALSVQKLPEPHDAQLLEAQLLSLQGHSQVLTTHLNPERYFVHLQNQNRDLEKETLLAES